MQKALRSPAVGQVILVFFLASLGFASFESTLSLQLKDTIHLDPQNSFLIFAYVGVVLSVAQGVYRGVLAKHLSEATFMGLGIILMAAGLLFLGGVNWLAVERVLASEVLLVLLMAALAVAVVGFAFLVELAFLHGAERLGAEEPHESAERNEIGPVLPDQLDQALFRLGREPGPGTDRLQHENRDPELRHGCDHRSIGSVADEA